MVFFINNILFYVVQIDQVILNTIYVYLYIILKSFQEGFTNFWYNKGYYLLEYPKKIL